MKKLGFAALVLILAFSCTQKPVPVAENTPTDPSERPAIAVEYVAVPQAQVRAAASADAAVIDSYEFTEAVSILEKKAEWCLVRTFSGTGWMLQKDLVAGDVKIDTDTPRFYTAPKEVPSLTDGEIAFQAQVNSDGTVGTVKTIKNTTGSSSLADANAKALQEARFYPMMEKGTRKTFVYEHHVYY